MRLGHSEIRFLNRRPEESHVVLKRKSAVIFLPVNHECGDLTSLGWRQGPYPFEVPYRGRVEIADGSWRRQKTVPRVHAPLYGIGRLHRDAPADESESAIPASVFGLELLRFRETSLGVASNSILVLHIQSESDGIPFISELAEISRDLDESRRDKVDSVVKECLSPSAELDRTQRIADSLVFATFDHGAPDTEKGAGLPVDLKSEWVNDATAWNRFDEWRWALAMLTPPARKTTVREDAGVAVQLPRRLGQVTPFGAAIVGTRRDAKGGPETQYVRDAIAVRTLYSDAMLLGICQREILNQISDSIAECGDPIDSARRVKAISGDLRIFRNTWYWSEFSTWRHPDKLLEGFQSIHQIPERLKEVTDEIRSYREEIELESQRRLTWLVTALTLVGLLGVIAGALQPIEVSTGAARLTLLISSVAILLSIVAAYAVILRVKLSDRRWNSVMGRFSQARADQESEGLYSAVETRRS